MMSRRSHRFAVRLIDTDSSDTGEIHADGEKVLCSCLRMHNGFQVASNEFKFAGGNKDPRTGYETVCALRLPSFAWTKVNDENERNGANCVSISSNNQLVSLSGVRFYNESRFEQESLHL